MAKPTRRYVCQDCGAVHAKWSGQCDACGAWNSVIEEQVLPALPGNSLKNKNIKGTIELMPCLDHQTGLLEI